MTTQTKPLTEGLASRLILRKYAQLGYVPCARCEQPIMIGQRITIKAHTGHYTSSRHYHARCFSSLYN